jgi:hypothetical protein
MKMPEGTSIEELLEVRLVFHVQDDILIPPFSMPTLLEASFSY